jgi:serine/threonine-protein kinase
MATAVMEKLVCPHCGHTAAGVKPGYRCPREDGYALVDPDALARAGKDPFLGRVLQGRYPLLALIGGGGMGAVYKAIQEPVGREVAIKVIRPEALHQDPGVVGRFQREARATARLEHENVVTLYDHGQDEDGTMFLVMELLRGQTLTSVLRARKVLPASEAVAVARPVLSALAAAHEMGLVHRDLKPENIMLVLNRDGEERVKVLDFGVAKVFSGEKDDVRTRANLVLGTPLYMSPEQAIGQGIGPASDLYAVGVVLYEMLTGAVPFNGETAYAVLDCHRNVPPRPFVPTLGVPAALEAAVMRALSKAAADRYASAREMSAALRTSLGGGAGDSSLRVSGGVAPIAPPAGEPDLPATVMSPSSQLAGQLPTGSEPAARAGRGTLWAAALVLLLVLGAAGAGRRGLDAATRGEASEDEGQSVHRAV